ncbi:aminotransferase class I/II-fold pyridoxal phosphate-dependent enzyme [Pseudomonas sp. M47T1]|uniref:aminotransferase class I/II-fold pyridoxal phosphate-dependent enzyme n=1 Tax=Pseudomonas sp. M47T1 TaxID=1179778 RepID=UPI0005B7F891|nr:PLP-dependent aminotransferase family protein [Pseudomonas sp. M47T1]
MSIKSQPGFAYQAVYRYLGALIDAGEPDVPFKLPSLRALARRLGVSVSTIQYGYTLLEREGRVYALAKSGYYARPPARLTAAKDGSDLLQRIQAEHRRQVGGQAPLLALDVPLLRLERQVQRQYGTLPSPAWHPCGDPQLRTALAARYTHSARHCWHADHVYLAGDLRGLLDITFEALALSGEPVLVASPCCPVVLQALRLAKVRLIELPLGDDGRLDLGSVRHYLETLSVRLMVLDAGFSSVQGARMPDADLDTLTALLTRHDVWLLENDAQGELRFEPGRCLRESVPAQRVLVIGSLEPWLGAEAPFAYLLAAGAHLPFTSAFQRRAMRLPPLRQKAVARLLEQGLLDDQLPALRVQLQQQLWRLDRQIRSRLGRYLLAVHPAGGTGLWLRSRYPMDMRKVFERLLARGQVVEPGTLFSAHGLHERYLRIDGLHLDSANTEALLDALGDAFVEERKLLDAMNG